MVGTQAEDGARDVRRQGWSRVGARACERVPHTPVRWYARTRAHSHALCMYLYVYMFESVSVCTSARSQADHDTMERRRTDAAPETRYCILNTRIAVCLVGLLRIRLIRRQFDNLIRKKGHYLTYLKLFEIFHDYLMIIWFRIISSNNYSTFYLNYLNYLMII